MLSTYLRAGLAAAAGAALLVASSGGYQAWHVALAAPAPSGPAVDAGAMRLLLTSPGGEPREVSPDGAIKAVVGDMLSVEVPVTLHTGDEPLSVLRVDVSSSSGDAALVEEFAANPTPVQVEPMDGAPDLDVVPGREHERVVTPLSDGASYVVRWSTSTRPTRDGESPGDGNAWGSGPESLQGLTVGARPLTISLVPNDGTTP
ncbi:MAG: hypothetical protein Q4G43_08415 [Mobilicoccus sp.]|nr:hypothetical protein [Mobilicoccus sp.]